MKNNKKENKKLGFKNEFCPENRLFGSLSNYFSFVSSANGKLIALVMRDNTRV